MATKQAEWTYYWNDQLVTEEDFNRMNKEHDAWVREQEKEQEKLKVAVAKEEAKVSKKKASKKA